MVPVARLLRMVPISIAGQRLVSQLDRVQPTRSRSRHIGHLDPDFSSAVILTIMFPGDSTAGAWTGIPPNRLSQEAFILLEAATNPKRSRLSQNSVIILRGDTPEGTGAASITARRHCWDDHSTLKN